MGVFRMTIVVRSVREVCAKNQASRDLRVADQQGIIKTESSSAGQVLPVTRTVPPIFLMLFEKLQTPWRST